MDYPGWIGPGGVPSYVRGDENLELALNGDVVVKDLCVCRWRKF